MQFHNLSDTSKHDLLFQNRKVDISILQAGPHETHDSFHKQAQMQEFLVPDRTRDVLKSICNKVRIT